MQPGSRGELAQADFTEAVLQSFVQDYPQTWAAKPPIAGWAWNTSPEKALSGMTSYQVATGLMPRSPTTSMIKAGAAREVITPNGYVQDLVASLHDVYKNVMKTQEEKSPRG